MTPEEMEKKMLQNMLEKTGQDIDSWIKLVNNKQLQTISEIVNFLKTEHSVGHFYAYLIAKKSIV